MESELTGWLWQCWTSSLRQTVSSGYSESEFDFVILTFCLTSCHPCECHFCQLWSQDNELHHVGLGDQLEDDDDGLLASWIFAFPQSPLSSEKLTIPSILALQDQVCCSDELWDPLQCRKLLILVLFEVLRELFFLPKTQVAPRMVPLACSSQDFADGSDLQSFSLPWRCVVVDNEVHDEV